MKSNKGKFVISLGLLLIATALFLTAYNLYDNFRAEHSVMQAIDRLDEIIPTEGSSLPPAANLPEEADIPSYVLNPNMEMPAETIDGIGYIGILRIPALNLELPVISQWSYPNLKVSPCRYAGSAYTDDFIIAAHNYSSHFGNLKALQEGDVVTFTDIDGNDFTYEVVEREILQATASKEMEAGDWDLTLFTCTVSGQSRVTVRCERTD